MVCIDLPHLFMGSLQYSNKNDTNHYFIVESHVLTFPKFAVRNKNHGSAQELYDEDASLFVKKMNIKNDALHKDIIWYCTGYSPKCSLTTGWIGHGKQRIPCHRIQTNARYEKQL
jgi:hypothetical protein